MFRILPLALALASSVSAAGITHFDPNTIVEGGSLQATGGDSVSTHNQAQTFEELDDQAFEGEFPARREFNRRLLKEKKEKPVFYWGWEIYPCVGCISEGGR